MGWLYRSEPVDDPVAHLTGQFDHDGERRRSDVLAAARAGSTVYMAVRSTEKATGAAFVFAAVILISNTRKDGFGYKDMDETMGPSECACPERIMRLLSPVGDIPNPGYAADWRARGAAHHASARELRAKRASLEPGCTVTLPAPVSFPGGVTAAAFRLCHVRRRTPVFEPVGRPGFPCRLRAAALATAVITPPAGPELPDR